MPAPLPPARPWHPATVVAARHETPTIRVIRLRLPHVADHLAGQHYVVRLTAPDGYTAARSYSAASPADGGADIELAVERLPDGEVSGFLHDVLEVGDTIELRGPIGGWFVWRGDGPALLVGGGSGLVPLVAMLRLGRRAAVPSPGGPRVHLVASVRTPADLPFAADLVGAHDVSIVHTRAPAPGEARAPGRLVADDLAPHVDDGATAYVCGSAGFADHVTALLIGLGVPAERLRIERFGPSG